MGKYKSEQAILNNRSRAKKWREENPERFRASTRAWYLKHKDEVCEIERHRSRFKLYGITKEQYEQMLEEHLNQCAICGKKVEDCEKSLSIDHDHETGKVRGLLCAGCNFLVGRIEDLGIEYILNYFNKYNIN